MELTSFDGKKIFIHEWKEVERPKGVVQIVHGMAEHAGRYEAYAKYLNAHGYIVVADDHRGHGKTDPKTLGYAKKDMYEGTVGDEEAICAHYRKEYPGLKYFLFGFSYGSFITQSCLARFGKSLDGAIIAGSNHKKDKDVKNGSLLSGLKCAFFGGKKPAKLIEKLSFGEYAKQFSDGQWLSTDAENNAKYAADPLCGFTCSYHFYKNFFKGLKRLYTRDYIEKLPKELPILVVSGKDDPVGEMGEGAKRLARFYRESAGMRQTELRLFEGSRHEFLNEKAGRELKWSTPLKFLDEVCGPRSGKTEAAARTK